MANKRLLEAAARKLIEKVHIGLRPSPLVSYSELKEALEAPEDISDGPVDGPIDSYNWRDEQ